MKKIITVAMLIFSISTFAQKYVTSSGDTLKIGDTVYVGKGTLSDGHYKYIEGMFSPGEGQGLIVKSFKNVHGANVVRLYMGGIAYLQANIDYALDAKELMLRPPSKGKVIQ